MRKMISTLVVLATFICSSGQRIELPGKGKITLKEVSRDTVYFLPFKLVDRPRATAMTITFSDGNRGTAARGRDYEYIAADVAPKTIAAASIDSFFSVGVIIKSRNIKRDTLAFTLSLLYPVNNGNTEPQSLEIKITPLNPADPKKDLPDTARWMVRLVAGSNFDFFEAPTFKNFAGDLNVFLPDLIQFNRLDKKGNPKQNNKKKDRKPISVGMQMGFFTFRYYNADSSKGSTYSERYLLNPDITQVVVNETQYVRETYTLNSRTNYNTFGAYLNPMVTLSQSKWFDLYANLHIEGLWRTEIQKYTKVSMRKDTMAVNSAALTQGLELNKSPGLRPDYNSRVFNDIYLGIGLPMRVNIKNAFELFTTTSGGMVSFEANNIITSDVTKLIRSRSFIKTMEWQPFIVTKAQLTTKVAPVEISLGGEFRHVFGEFSGSTDVQPQRVFYAVYLGASFQLDTFIK
jgi:hypothetical protein